MGTIEFLAISLGIFAILAGVSMVIDVVKK